MIMDESSGKCRSLSSKSLSQDNQLFPPLVAHAESRIVDTGRQGVAASGASSGFARRWSRCQATQKIHQKIISGSYAGCLGVQLLCDSNDRCTPTVIINAFSLKCNTSMDPILVQQLERITFFINIPCASDLSSATANGTAKFKTPLPVCKPPPMLSPKQHNTVRIIAQYLRDLGLTESLDALTEESGCKVENAHASRLRDLIYKANWSDALAVLDKCFAYLKPQELNAAKTIILEEKFYDLLHKNDTPAALRLLREEFPTRPEVMDKRSSMIRMLFMDKQQLAKVPEANKYRSKSDRKKLAVKIQRVLPAQFILPAARLEQLLDQAYSYQVSKCRVHMRNDYGDTTMEANAIFTDHSCRSPETKRYENIQTLRNHATEVWCVEFSQDGKMLASGSKTNCIHVWKVDTATKLVKPYKQLGNRDAIDVLSCMSWSSDSKFLAVAGTEQMPFDILVFNVKEGCIHRTIRNLQTSLFTTCVFFNAKNHFLVAGDERGHMKVFICTNYHSKKFENVGLAKPNFGKKFFWGSSRQFGDTCEFWRWKPRIYCNWNRGYVQISIVSRMYTYLSLSWDIFADHKVAIWNVDNCRPVLKLRGHKRVVNAVAWNPKNPTMLASCSEDKTVRIWSVARSGDIEASGHKMSRKHKLRRNASNREHKKNGTCK
uniref:LisH domain-containing protein n=1 Tax=Heterorhabditis bacteriophora TaxID=37862 RepID=A0A1I7WYM5_HETBA